MNNRLTKYLPKYYKGSEIFKEITSSQSKEFDKVYDNLEDLNKQFLVDTATWGLDIYEKTFGLEVNPPKTLADRRSIIKAKIRGVGKVDNLMIKAIVEAFTNNEVVIEFDGTIVIVFKDSTNIRLNNRDMIYSIEEVKPAHLGYKFESRIKRVVKIKSYEDKGNYKVPITNRYPTGVWPWITNRAKVNDSLVEIRSSNDYGKSIYPTTGRLITSPCLYKQIDSIRYIEYIRKLAIRSMHDARDPNILTTDDFLTGTRPWLINKVHVSDSEVISFSEPKYGFNKYATTGRFMPSGKLPFTEYVANAYVGEVSSMIQKSREREGVVTFPEINTFLTGEIPWMQNRANVNDSKESSRSKHIDGPVRYPVTGIFRTGKEVK